MLAAPKSGLNACRQTTATSPLKNSMCLCLVLVCGAAAAADADQDPVGGAITPSLTYDGDVAKVLHGGARTGGVYSGLLHLRLQAKAPTTSAWAGTSALIDVRTIHGSNPSARVGDAQGVSNIAGPSGTDIEELWVQHNFAGRGVSVLAGIYDINSEFYRLQAAGLFLNSSFGIGPEFSQSGVEGPSIFPRTAIGVRVALKPAPGVVLRAAILDGVPVVRPDGSRRPFSSGDGELVLAEFAVLSRATQAAEEPLNPRARIGRFSALAPYRDKLALGTWRYTGTYPDISPAGSLGVKHGSSGAYAVGEWRLLGREDDALRTLAAFMQLGVADPTTNRFRTYVGLGVVGIGWVLGRPRDQLGVAVASARNGSPYLQSQWSQGRPATRAETTIELSYLTQITKRLTVQPGFQYVMHPNSNRDLQNAWVAQVRFELGF